jgi:hypothetical protein
VGKRAVKRREVLIKLKKQLKWERGDVVPETARVTSYNCTGTNYTYNS